MPSAEEFIVELLGGVATIQDARHFFDELGNNSDFIAETNELSMAHRGVPAVFAGWSKIHYALTRILRPKVIVETGVFDGLSSACWLLALDKNDHGELVSIDLPATVAVIDSIHTSLPKGQEPGWIIADSLRARHRLLLGDARELLPPILSESPVDIFFHDSLHTEDHMLFEYRAAYEQMQADGLILSDDYRAYDSFSKFARGLGLETFVSYDGLAGLRKSSGMGRGTRKAIECRHREP